MPNGKWSYTYLVPGRTVLLNGMRVKRRTVHILVPTNTEYNPSLCFMHISVTTYVVLLYCSLSTLLCPCYTQNDQYLLSGASSATSEIHRTHFASPFNAHVHSAMYMLKCYVIAEVHA